VLFCLLWRDGSLFHQACYERVVAGELCHLSVAHHVDPAVAHAGDVKLLASHCNRSDRGADFLEFGVALNVAVQLAIHFVDSAAQPNTQVNLVAFVVFANEFLRGVAAGDLPGGRFARAVSYHIEIARISPYLGIVRLVDGYEVFIVGRHLTCVSHRPSVNKQRNIIQSSVSPT
jgi:hypothetical protein